MPRALKREQRLAVADRQVTHSGPDGNSGVFVVGYQNSDKRPTLDVRFFAARGHNFNKHKSTRFGIILNSMAEALDCASKIIQVVKDMRELGLKDLEGEEQAWSGDKPQDVA